MYSGFYSSSIRSVIFKVGGNNQMNKQEFLLRILLETIPVKCKYYKGDEEECLKYVSNDGSDFPTCNCGGDILECDLFDFVKQCNLWEFVGIKPKEG